MSQQIQKKKNIQITHLIQSIKTHKQQYLRRPLSIATTPVYLNSVAYLSQLIPTFLSHYLQILKQQQVNSLTTDLILLFQDMMTKLKSTADKLQERQKESFLSKHSELQKVTHNLQHLKLNQTTCHSQMTKDMKCNRCKEQTDIFTPLQNKLFYQELKEALQKKQQVLAICHSQSLEYADLLDEQIHDILTLKESLIFKLQKQGQNVNGEELKKEVSNSLKQQWRKKLPDITRLVGHKILNSLQKRRKSQMIDMGVQTEDVQNAKITQFKRKIAHLQELIHDQKTRNQKLTLSCQKKQLLIKKIEAQLQQMREQYHKKQYDMQKSIKNLQETTRRQKQQFSKQKSRKILTERQMPDYPLKSIKTLRQLHQQPEKKASAQKQAEEPMQNDQRYSKKKKTMYSANRSAKYLLSTMNKIESKDFSLTNQTQHSETNMILKTSRTERLNETIMAQIQNQKSQLDFRLKKQTNQIGTHSSPKQYKQKLKQNKEVVGKNQIRSNISKNTAQHKTVEHKIKKVSKNSNIAQRLGQKNIKQKSRLSKRQEIRLPSVNKNKNEAKRLQTSNITIQSDQEQVSRKKTGRFYEGDTNTQQQNMINQVCQQVPSSATLKSIVSLMGKNISSKEKVIRKQKQQKIKQQNTERYNQPHPQFNKRQISFQNMNLTDRVKSVIEKENQLINFSHKQVQQNSQNWQKKYLLDANFEKINQEIQKQNYLTPVIGIQSPGLEINRRLMTQISDIKEKNDEKEQFKLCLQLLIAEFPSINQGKTNLQKLKKIIEQIKKRKYLQLTNQKNQLNSHVRDQNSSNFKVKENNVIHDENNNRNKNGLMKFLKKSLTEGPDMKTNHYKIDYLYKQILTPQINPILQLSIIQQRESFPTLQKKLPLISPRQQESSLHYTNMLFLDEQMAFKYQTEFSKKMSKKTKKLREEVQCLGQNLIIILQKLRNVDKITYQKVCRQLRYPFSSRHRNYLQIQIVSGMSGIVVNQCLQILVGLHKKCHTITTNCQHFNLFKLKLEGLIISNKKQ